MITQTTTLDGVVLAKGVRFHAASNLEKGMRFRFEAVCEDHRGAAWRVEVSLSGRKVIETGVFDGQARAIAEAERMLVDKFVALLSE